MYVPQAFAVDDRSELCDFIRAHPFGILVSAGAGAPLASHVPFVILEDEAQLVLGCHVARANDHWQSIAGNTALAIFSGAHGYVSPSWYEDPSHSVPTWDYAAVQAESNASIASAERTRKILERLVERMESGFARPWRLEEADAAYIDGMRKAIVGIELTVRKLTGVRKYSQNRTASERVNVVRELERSKDPQSRELAARMREITDS